MELVFVLLLVASLGGLAVAQLLSASNRQERTSWSLYKSNFGKSYTSIKEDSMRRAIYFRNKANFERHNKRNSSSYRKGVNQFSDLTEAELSELGAQHTYFTLAPPLIKSKGLEKHQRKGGTGNEAFDWRSVKGRVGWPPKSVGKCDASWAFATTGLLEGQQAALNITRGENVVISLSEQQLIDCSAETDSCRGGSVVDALVSVKQSEGINSEQTYPYAAKRRADCDFDGTKVVMSIRKIVANSISERQLMRLVSIYGPVAIGFYATKEFYYYSGGVLLDGSCPKDGSINRYGLVVGYGTDSATGLDFWIVVSSKRLILVLSLP